MWVYTYHVVSLTTLLYCHVFWLQGTGQSSQAGIGGGTYAPAIAGGAIAQPIPIGSGHEMLGYQFDDEEMMKLKAERGGKAGGWSLELSKKRALEEAFGSIWI